MSDLWVGKGKSSDWEETLAKRDEEIQRHLPENIHRSRTHVCYHCHCWRSLYSNTSQNNTFLQLFRRSELQSSTSRVHQVLQRVNNLGYIQKQWHLVKPLACRFCEYSCITLTLSYFHYRLTWSITAKPRFNYAGLQVCLSSLQVPCFVL